MRTLTWLLTAILILTLAIILILPLAINRAPVAPPEEKPTLAPEEEFLELTSQQLKEKVLDPRLAEAQREEMWNNLYKGKRVKWLGVYGFGEIHFDRAEAELHSGKDVLVSFPMDPELARTLSTLIERGDDVVWFTGILADFGWPLTDFILQDGEIFLPPVAKKVWSNRWELWEHVPFHHWDVGLVGVDSRFLYYYQSYDESVLRVYDKNTGFFVSEEIVKSWEEAERITIAKADNELLLYGDRIEQKVLDGLVLKISEDDEGIDFYDKESGLLLCKLPLARGPQRIHLLLTDQMIFGVTINIIHGTVRLFAYQLEPR